MDIKCSAWCLWVSQFLSIHNTFNTIALWGNLRGEIAEYQAEKVIPVNEYVVCKVMVGKRSMKQTQWPDWRGQDWGHRN